MRNGTGNWENPNGKQSITTTSWAKVATSPGEYRNSCTNGASETRQTALGAHAQHKFLDCPTVTAFWGQLIKTLHDLLGPHPLQKRQTLCGDPTLGRTPQQLANYLLVLAKPTTTSLSTRVSNEAAIPTTPRNAPQHMVTWHRDLHELLAT
jgi:hypothetical protein